MYTFFLFIRKNFFEENQPQKPQNLKKMLRKSPTCKSIGRCVFRKTLSNIQYGTFCKNEYRQKLIFAKQLIFVEWFIVDVWGGSKNFIFTLLCSATKESVHILRDYIFPRLLWQRYTANNYYLLLFQLFYFAKKNICLWHHKANSPPQ